MCLCVDPLSGNSRSLGKRDLVENFCCELDDNAVN